MKRGIIARRARRTREKVKQSGRPRLSVFRSNRYTYGQIIDDRKRVTLAAASTQELPPQKGKSKQNKSEEAFEAGKLLAERAGKEHVEEVAFDKGPYRYHGRVRRLAEGAREGGLKF